MAQVKASGPSNISTAKRYGDIADSPVDVAGKPRFANTPNKKAQYQGEISGTQGKGDEFAQPLNKGGVSAEICGISGLHNDIGEMSGFITDGYLDKGDTPYGEAAKLNFLPPGMDISNQQIAQINEMPLRKIVAESYPGDGWSPAPSDIPE